MHPVVYLLGWLWLAVAVQFLDIAWMLMLLIPLAIAGESAMRRWGRMLWRAKWLIFTLLIIVSYAQPGVLPYGVAWAPSWEGMRLAARHALILFLMLGGLAVLMTRLERDELLLAMYLLLNRLLPSPWVERGAARMLLVFEYVEQAPERGYWRSLLRESASCHSPVVHLVNPAWRLRDRLAMGGLVLMSLLLAGQS